MRLHRLPHVTLCIGDVETRMLARTRSALTGSSSAGCLARCIIEDTLLMSKPLFQDVFDVEHGTFLDSLCWSDNVSMVVNKTETAAYNMSVFASTLFNFYGMRLKPDSFLAVPARHRQQGESIVSWANESWRVLDCAPCLGGFVTSTGQDKTEREKLVKSWSRLFWANKKLLCNVLAPKSSRIKFWRRLVFSVSDHRLASIRPVKRNILQLESVLNKFTAKVLTIRPEDQEDPRAFAIRRNREVRSCKHEFDFSITDRYCMKITSWMEHLLRHPERPCKRLLDCQSSLWLRFRRIMIGMFGQRRSQDAGETRTRAGPGVPLRWAGRWIEEVGERVGGWENPNRDKSRTREHAKLLKEWLLGPSPTHLALEDG